MAIGTAGKRGRPSNASKAARPAAAFKPKYDISEAIKNVDNLEQVFYAFGFLNYSHRAIAAKVQAKAKEKFTVDDLKNLFDSRFDYKAAYEEGLADIEARLLLERDDLLMNGSEKTRSTLVPKMLATLSNFHTSKSAEPTGEPRGISGVGKTSADAIGFDEYTADEINAALIENGREDEANLDDDE